MKGTWKQIATAPLLRSSHSVAVVKGTIFIFGGEIKPRVPVDDKVYAVELSGGKHTALEAKGSSPCARVGHASGTIGSTFYVFGGRGGPALDPLEENGRVWAFDTAAETWACLDPAEGSPVPPSRSYHAALGAVMGAGEGESVGVFFIHAGCVVNDGRSGDLWGFDVKTRRWTQYPTAPGIGRGGTTFCMSGSTLYRFGGFDGTSEVGGGIDALKLSVEGGAVKAEGDWQTIPQAAGSPYPGPRSVCSMQTVKVGGAEKLVLVMGERDPSPDGHLGAGKFYNDAWVFDPATAAWAEVEVPAKPEQRGWIAAGTTEESQLVLWGGLGEKNERLGDCWVLAL